MDAIDKTGGPAFPMIRDMRHSPDWDHEPGMNWRDGLRAGFAECFRVLDTDGVLVFKWNETQVKIREVLALTPHRPLFGNTSGKKAGTHWMVFMKPRAEASA